MDGPIFGGIPSTQQQQQQTQDDSQQPQDAIFGDRVRRFQEFLDRIDANSGIDYRSQIKDMIIKGKFRLSVSIDEIREFDREFWYGLLNQPADFYLLVKEH